jgi:hypothetical protein
MTGVDVYILQIMSSINQLKVFAEELSHPKRSVHC